MKAPFAGDCLRYREFSRGICFTFRQKSVAIPARNGEINYLPMKKFWALALSLVLIGTSLILLEGCNQKSSEPVKSSSLGIASAEKTSFKDVTSKLDAGGNLYVYLSTEQWLTNLSGYVGHWRDSLAALPGDQNQHDQIQNAFNVGTRLIKDSGLEDISGVGMSSIAREPGLYHNKLIVHHYAGEGNGFIWAMFGKEPHELAGLDFLPTNTALAMFHDLDVAEVWDVIKKECQQSGFPEATQFLDEFPQEFEKGAGMKWDDVVGSLGGEFGIVLTLNDSRMVTIPLPTQEPLDIPEPGLMLVVKVKNDAIFNRFEELIKKSGQQPIIVDEKGLKMRTVPVPIPLPITLRPSVAMSGGYFFFATSDALIREAVAVKGGKAGLKSTDEFKKLAEDVPQQGNQFCFLSKRFGQTIVKIQQQALTMNKQAPPQLKQLMESFVRPENVAYSFGVGANTSEGWMMVANGSQSGGKVLAATAIVPTAVLAGVALPAFAKAKEAAQKNALHQ